MASGPPPTVWPILHYDEPETALRFLGVMGFREALVIRDDRDAIVHAEMRWPEGGTVLVGSTDHSTGVHGGMRSGAAAMYVPTEEVDGVHRRMHDAGANVVSPPHQTRFAGTIDAYAFTVEDPAGHLWTFGTYPGAA